MALQLTPLPAARFEERLPALRSRLIRRTQESGLRIGADAEASADRLIAEVFPYGAQTDTSALLSVIDGDREVGTLWVAANAGKLFLLEVRTTDAVDHDELFAAVRDLAALRETPRIGIALFPQDAAGRALIAGRGFSLASIQMVQEPMAVRSHDPAVVIERMTAERFPAYAAASEAAFADDLVASGRYTPEQAAEESRRQMGLELPDGVDSAGQSLFTASVDGQEVGILWVGARLRDDRPYAFVLDVEVGAGHRRKGYGRALMLAAEEEARAFGAESIGLHVFGFNTGAIDLYEQLGYRRVEESYLLDL